MGFLCYPAFYAQRNRGRTSYAILLGWPFVLSLLPLTAQGGGESWAWRAKGARWNHQPQQGESQCRQVGRGGLQYKEKHLISIWGSLQRTFGGGQWSTWVRYTKKKKSSLSPIACISTLQCSICSMSPTGKRLHCCSGSVFTSTTAAWPGKGLPTHSVTLYRVARNWEISVEMKDEEHSSKMAT